MKSRKKKTIHRILKHRTLIDGTTETLKHIMQERKTLESWTSEHRTLIKRTL